MHRRTSTWPTAPAYRSPGRWISWHPSKRRGSDLQIFPDKGGHPAEELVCKVGTETDHLRVVFVDREAHLAALNPKAGRLHRQKEFHGARMDHIRCELGISGPHRKAVIELLVFEADLLAAPAAADGQHGKGEGRRDRGQDLGVIFGHRASLVRPSESVWV